ncbi:hypothetical protein VP1G_10638 [Cytospora mali]|uniref:Uncharacterized protein n=1 Tax=Cytospora mali TaxID=578113 RepID=A0A194USZ1_CYTMA|nr:hypothetical protein VP1G_10638 [Valsa mali var. pyri (nom. inval.)]
MTLSNGTTTEQTRAPRHPKVSIQRPSEQDTPASQRRPEKVVPGKQARRVLRVADGDVDEDALHHDEHGGAVDGDAYGGRYPGEARGGSPGKDEEADGGAERREESGHEAVLLHRPPFRPDARVHVEVDVADVYRDADDAGYHDAQEDQADLPGGHVVVDRVDEREHLEEAVVDPVYDCRVDLHEEDGRVLEGDLDGLDQRLDQDPRRLQVALVDLALRHEALVACQLAETLCAPQEDVRRAGLREEEEHDEEDRRGGPDDLEERPPPSHDRDGVSGE